MNYIENYCLFKSKKIFKKFMANPLPPVKKIKNPKRLEDYFDNVVLQDINASQNADNSIIS